MKHIFAVILSIMLLTACGESERNSQLLKRAETVMEDSAEVALAILQDSIDSASLSTERGRAIHALLLSQALDKNYIDIASDSIIAPAVKYFASGEEPLYAMLAHYYYGRVFENANDNHNAIAQYTKATNYINQTSDHLIHGLIFSHLGNLYSNSCDYPKSIEAYLNAYNSYKLANSYNHKIYSLYDLSCSYRGNQDYNNANKIISQVIAEATDSCDHRMIQTGNEEFIIQQINIGCYKNAIKLYESLKSQYTDNSPYSNINIYLANAFAFLQDSKTAEFHINKAWELANSTNDSIVIFYKSSKIYEYLNDYPKSLECLSNGVILENKMLRKELEQPLLTAQRNLLAQDLEISKYKLHQSIFTIVTILLVSIIIILLIVLYSRRRILKKQQLINEYTETILSLRDTLNSKDKTYSAIINDLFDYQYSILNDIGNTFADISDNATDQKRLYQEVKEIIFRFENPKTQSELEKIINRYRNNLMQKLRLEFPNLSNDEYKQICYHYAGFSPKFISLLMHQKYPTIYKRRSRIKDKISASNSSLKDELLAYI
ncbi:MAG: hypothetical protein E7081_09385 [Bacteroidales bacterium]|nr:hypothetical protein [Bacteroidales bacterium]